MLRSLDMLVDHSLYSVMLRSLDMLVDHGLEYFLNNVMPRSLDMLVDHGLEQVTWLYIYTHLYDGFIRN